MNFKSDNTVPVNPEIINAISASNHGYQASYGADEYSLKLQKRLSDIFEKDVLVYLTNTGTAANSLALSALVKPYELIFCSSQAHIYTDECGAPEFYAGGAKMMPIESLNGKIDLDPINEQIQVSLSLRPHGQKPGCVSLTQATEAGTVYTIRELEEISEFCKKQSLPIHMDGARFANSLVHLQCRPADITWKAGVDVMSFGATKNGALCAEAILFFNHKYAENFDYLHKRSGQLMSKSRFFACQFLSYLEEDLWLKNAQNANQKAQELAQVFRKHDIEIVHEVQANEVFVKLSPECYEYLQKKGCGFYEWGASTSDLCRFVTSWVTSKSDIEQVDACLAEYSDDTR
ncbi:MAG TPA: low specificity L-threonine aldolase [Alphaproteobacteria bacterium]|nr:low specificity L-threonine aldolase [Alphaproteobacteria bacterium]HQS94523.1 low specificity L-threonine aldolase [Alphaproteobacteria bacterium]